MRVRSGWNRNRGKEQRFILQYQHKTRGILRIFIRRMTDLKKEELNEQQKHRNFIGRG